MRLVLIGVLVLIGGLGAVVVWVPHGTQLCVGCRVEREVVSVAGLDVPLLVSGNACSRWVGESVPGHAHAWRRTGCWRVDGWNNCYMQPIGAAVPDADWLETLQRASATERQELLDEAANITPPEDGFTRARELTQRAQHIRNSP